MKEIRLYCCDVCGTNYNDKATAQKCEKNHKLPVNLKPTKWQPKGVQANGYPKVVTVKFADGSRARYDYAGRVYNENN